MSILTERAKKVDDMPLDGVFVIYGPAGTGKTVLASTFPKTKEKPMLYLDILEGGTGSISKSERDNIIVVPIQTFEEVDAVLEDVLAGKTTDENGNVIPISYSTIVIDSGTQLEFLLKKGLMENNNKSSMSLQLWGQARQSHDALWNMCKSLNQITGSNVVAICHQKEVTDEENPGNNKIIPSLMNAAAYSLCAKASFVWYTKIEQADEIITNADGTTTTVPKQNFVAYIDSCQAYLTKTRKPKEMTIPLKVKNLTYAKFKKNILDKM